jgi:hypothetical protein
LRGHDLATAYATADLFVYGSETETMGNVVMEAMSSGLPVVVPNAGGIPSLLKDGESGLLYRPGDHDAAAAGVAKLLEDPALRQSIGDHAREHVERCGWRTSVNEVRNSYREAIEQFGLAPARPSQTHWCSSMAVTSLVFTFRCGSWLRGDWGRPASSLATNPSNA